MLATITPAPIASSAAVSPISSSPARTTLRPASQAEQHELARAGAERLDVVHGQRPVGEQQRREQRVVGAEAAVAGEVGAVALAQRGGHGLDAGVRAGERRSRRVERRERGDLGVAPRASPGPATSSGAPGRAGDGALAAARSQSAADGATRERPAGARGQRRPRQRVQRAGRHDHELAVADGGAAAGRAGRARARSAACAALARCAPEPRCRRAPSGAARSGAARARARPAAAGPSATSRARRAVTVTACSAPSTRRNSISARSPSAGAQRARAVGARAGAGRRSRRTWSSRRRISCSSSRLARDEPRGRPPAPGPPRPASATTRAQLAEPLGERRIARRADGREVQRLRARRARPARAPRRAVRARARTAARARRARAACAAACARSSVAPSAARCRRARAARRATARSAACGIADGECRSASACQPGDPQGRRPVEARAPRDVEVAQRGPRAAERERDPPASRCACDGPRRPARCARGAAAARRAAASSRAPSAPSPYAPHAARTAASRASAAHVGRLLGGERAQRGARRLARGRPVALGERHLGALQPRLGELRAHRRSRRAPRPRDRRSRAPPPTGPRRAAAGSGRARARA